MATSTGSSGQFYQTQNYLRCFRVAELKELLKALNVSTAGRKKDLLDRVETLLQLDTPDVHRHAQNIYDKNFGTKHHERHPPKTPPKPPMSCTSSVAPPSFHVKFPDVKLKPHPFYQQVDTIVRPTYLVSQTDRHYKDKMMVLQFHLSPQHIQEIFISETTPGNYQTQVILRLCRRETSCEQEDYCPMRCNIRINKNPCPIPGFNPDLSCKPDYKYQMKPLNITSYVHTSPALANTVTISWHEDILYPQGFCISVQLSRALSSSDLLQSLKGRGIKSAEISKAMVKEKLAIGKDEEISSTSLRVSLTCPLGKMKMTYPCRSISCSHLQCFDAAIYLQLNEKKARWVCPVCDRKAPFVDLIIDGLMMEICSGTGSNENEIEFSGDASWRCVNKSESKVTCSLAPVVITDSPLQTAIKPGAVVPMSPVVIDLTGDSDSDEQPISLSSNVPDSVPYKEEPSSPSLLIPSSPPLSSTSHRLHSSTVSHPSVIEMGSRLLNRARIFNRTNSVIVPSGSRSDSNNSRPPQTSSYNTSNNSRTHHHTGSGNFRPMHTSSRPLQTSSNNDRPDYNSYNGLMELPGSLQWYNSDSYSGLINPSTTTGHWRRPRKRSMGRHDTINKRKHYVPIYNNRFSSSSDSDDDDE